MEHSEEVIVVQESDQKIFSVEVANDDTIG
jgi:hypothetical protein